MSFTTDNVIEVRLNSEVEGDRGVGGTTSDWTTVFSNPVQFTPNDFLHLAARNASAPNTCPQFATNEISYSVLQEGETVQVLTIPQTRVFGSTSDFLTYFQTALNALTTVDVTIALDADTKLVSITNNSAGYLRLNRGIYAPFWNKLGFTAAQETASDYIELASLGVLLSRKVSRLIRTQRYYVCCKNTFKNAKTANDDFSEILCTIDIENEFGSYSSEQYNYLYWHQINDSNVLSGLSFYLLDDQRRPIEYLSGGGVCLDLLLKVVPQNEIP